MTDDELRRQLERAADQYRGAQRAYHAALTRPQTIYSHNVKPDWPGFYLEPIRQALMQEFPQREHWIIVKSGGQGVGQRRLGLVGAAQDSLGAVEGYSWVGPDNAHTMEDRLWFFLVNDEVFLLPCPHRFSHEDLEPIIGVQQLRTRFVQAVIAGSGCEHDRG